MKHVVTREYGEIEGRSSAMATEEAALSLAYAMIDAGVEVLRIERDGEEQLSGTEILERHAWKRPRSSRPRRDRWEP